MPVSILDPSDGGTASNNNQLILESNTALETGDYLVTNLMSILDVGGALGLGQTPPGTVSTALFVEDDLTIAASDVGHNSVYMAYADAPTPGLWSVQYDVFAPQSTHNLLAGSSLIVRGAGDLGIGSGYQAGLSAPIGPSELQVTFFAGVGTSALDFTPGAGWTLRTNQSGQVGSIHWLLRGYTSTAHSDDAAVWSGSGTLSSSQVWGAWIGSPAEPEVPRLQTTGDIRDWVSGDPDPGIAKKRHHLRADVRATMDADTDTPITYVVLAEVESEFKGREGTFEWNDQEVFDSEEGNRLSRAEYARLDTEAQFTPGSDEGEVI